MRRKGKGCMRFRNSPRPLKHVKMSSTLNKYYVPFNRAEKLRDLGFKEYCDSYYNVNIDIIKSWGEVDSPNNMSDKSYVNRPLFSQAFDWFREKYNKDSFIVRCNSTKEYFFDISWRNKKGLLEDFQSKDFKTHPEAELACLDKLIEMANEKV